MKTFKAAKFRALSLTWEFSKIYRGFQNRKRVFPNSIFCQNTSHVFLKKYLEVGGARFRKSLETPLDPLVPLLLSYVFRSTVYTRNGVVKIILRSRYPFTHAKDNFLLVLAQNHVVVIKWSMMGKLRKLISTKVVIYL